MKKYLPFQKKAVPLHRFYGDSLAQLVEHNTFNVGVLGSSPKRITNKISQLAMVSVLADFAFQKSPYRGKPCSIGGMVNPYTSKLGLTYPVFKTEKPCYSSSGFITLL